MTNPKDYRHKVKHVLARIRQKYNLSGDFTKADYLRICEGERVTHVEIALTGNGYYVRSKKRNLYIYINSNLSETDFLDTAAHELGHHLMHKQKLLKGVFGRNKKAVDIAQNEADYFAELLTGRNILDAEILESILDAEVLNA